MSNSKSKTPPNNDFIIESNDAAMLEKRFERIKEIMKNDFTNVKQSRSNQDTSKKADGKNISTVGSSNEKVLLESVDTVTVLKKAREIRDDPTKQKELRDKRIKSLNEKNKNLASTINKTESDDEKILKKMKEARKKKETADR